MRHYEYERDPVEQMHELAERDGVEIAVHVPLPHQFRDESHDWIAANRQMSEARDLDARGAA